MPLQKRSNYTLGKKDFCLKTKQEQKQKLAFLRRTEHQLLFQMHKCFLGFKVMRSPLRLSLQVFCTKLFSVLESIGSCWLAAQHSNGCSNLQLVNVYIWCTININDYGTVLDSLLTEMSIFRFLPYSTLFSFCLFVSVFLSSSSSFFSFSFLLLLPVLFFCFFPLLIDLTFFSSFNSIYKCSSTLSRMAIRQNGVLRSSRHYLLE